MPSTNSPNLAPSTKPIRILHVVSGMDRGGAETWLMHMLRHIDRDRYQMDFMSQLDTYDAYFDEIKSLGSQIFSCTGQSQPLLYAQKFRQIIRDHGPYDLIQVHLHHFSGYILYLAKQAGIKVRVVHSHIDTSSIESTANWQRKAYVALMKWSISKNATAGLAASEMAAADLFGTNWKDDLRWQTLYCGIDLAPFCQPIDTANLRAEFGIGEDELVIGHVGRFESQKNHHFLLEIFAEITKREPKTRLLLIGIGSLRSEIEAKAIQMGLANRVIFLGARPDVPRLMRGLIDVFLFPSLYEGLGLVLVEAQAAGLPCTFSDIVPEEADIVKSLIQRLSLTKPASEWARVILESLSKKHVVSQAQSLELVAQSVFNLQVSLQELTQFYDQEINCSKSVD